jgi:hypothetical protein
MPRGGDQVQFAASTMLSDPMDLEAFLFGNYLEVLRKQLIFLLYLVSQPPFRAGRFGSKRIPNSFRIGIRENLFSDVIIPKLTQL